MASEEQGRGIKFYALLFAKPLKKRAGLTISKSRKSA